MIPELLFSCKIQIELCTFFTYRLFNPIVLPNNFFYFVAMNLRKLSYILLVASAAFVNSCSTQKPTKKTVAKKPATAVQRVPQKPVQPKEEILKFNLPEVNREFRAAWVATVANINWPSRNNLSTQQQKDEAVRILDLLKDANFNAVIFQARPSADAMYPSELEPWSYFLTGEIGKAPSPLYDPLKFWIDESHKRGMELHVWLNPYRAHHTTGGPVSSQSMVKKMPEQIVKLRNGMYWMDPSAQETQDLASNVIRDLVKRYDMDAVHIDDYFYPYREYNGGKDFPDNKTWSTYLKSGGTLSRADWRRGNVNKFIKRIHDEIKAEKPSVRFGISPFGIWKPGFPAGIKGSSQYDELYADAKLWLNEGWLDYFSPQLYWKSEGPQSFPALLKWWDQENYKKVHLWPGLNTVGIAVSDKPSEIAGQIRTTRSLLKNAAGVIHYSVDGISKSPAMLSTLKTLYSEPALVPASPWIKTKAVLKPEITAKRTANSVQTSWFSRDADQVRQWVLFTQYGDNWETEILPAAETSRSLSLAKNGKNLKNVALRAVDKLGNESEYAGVAVN